jgi:hypothetical protein
MNQTIQQRRDILNGLRERAASARDEFNAKPRFVVVSHRNNLFGIVDRQTGVERAEVAGHNSACQAAQSFENVADFTRAAQLSVGKFARLLLCWTAAFAVILAVFVLMGMNW